MAPTVASSTHPAGFRLSGAAIAKETHGQPIYCVAWSTDLYGGGAGADRPPAPAERGGTTPREDAEGSDRGVAGGIGGGGGGGGDDGGGTPADASETPLPSASSSPRPHDDPAATAAGDGGSKPPAAAASGGDALVRCLATCGGNHVTIYEVEYGGGGGGGGGGGLSLRQAYRDADPDETFYTCAFGGRGLGSHVGFGPKADLVRDGKARRGHTIVLRGDEDDDDENDSAGRGKHTEGQEKHDSPDDKLSMRRDGVGPPSRKRETADTKSAEIARRNEKRRKLFQTLADLSKYDGPQLLCAAGRRGIVKVIDTVRRSLLLTLSGHGDEIYDMKFSPVDEWLLLTASKDESLRLWNVKCATCVAIFAGHEGHRDAVLSCSWHPLGRQFASAGMDTTVKLWSLETKEVKDAIDESHTVPPRRKKGLAAMKAAGEGTTAPPQVFKPFYEQMPYFSTSKVHTDYVDCVQFVGDLILSKSINDIIVLWKPDLSCPSRSGGNTNNNNNNGRAGAHHNNRSRTRNEVIALREFVLNKSDIWFIRFQTDADCRMLASGNNIGEVKVWDVTSSNPTKKHFANLTHQHCASTVRMVSFSPDGRTLLATCDDSSVWKWDAF